MEKKSAFRFLVKTAIPPIDRKKCPEGVKNDRLWDAIWRAHRDVLTGRFHLKAYCAEKNAALMTLYKKIQEIHHANQKLTSRLLIEALHEKHKEIEFGAIQKLVNMTLKYILILNAFEQDFAIAVDEAQCDCPLDSIIFDKLSGNFPTWTNIDPDNYKRAQDEIRKQLQESGHGTCGNIVFDFEKW